MADQEKPDMPNFGKPDPGKPEPGESEPNADPGEEYLQEKLSEEKDLRESISEKMSPDDAIKSREPFRLNKKAILYALIGFFVAAYGVMAFLRPMILKRKAEKAELAEAEVMKAPIFQRSENPSMPVGEEFVFTLPEEEPVLAPTFEEPKPTGVSSISSAPAPRAVWVDPEEEAARRAGIMVGLDGEAAQAGAGAQGIQGALSPLSLPGASGLQNSQELAGTLMDQYLSQTGTTSYQSQNNQEAKQAFYEEGQNDLGGGYQLTNEFLGAGTMIPALFRTEINSDLPGEAVAMVSENVWDSLTGRNLLIPQGSLLIARYSSDISYRQKRVQIAWRYLRRPDGLVIPLGNMPGADSLGASGAKGRVNNHIFDYLLAMGYASLYSVAMGEITALRDAGGNNLNALIDTNTGIMDQAVGELLDRTLDIQPTIKVKAGTRVSVFVNQDIRLPAVKAPAASEKYVL